MFRHPKAAREPDALRQVLLLQLQSNGIVLGIGHIGQPIDHAQDEEHGGVNAQRDAGISKFNFVQSGPADRGALSQDRGRYAPPPGIANIVAQLAPAMRC